MKAVSTAVHTETHPAGLLVPIAEPETFDPALNLAREASYIKTVGTPAFRVWRSTDSLVLGRFLKPEEEVFAKRAAGLGVPVLRRPSGGGAVFHDLGNINYSFYLPPGHAPRLSIEQSLRALSFPVTRVLEHCEVPWSWEPPNSVYVLGRKISGSAQARSGGRLLHHGTLLVGTDLEKMNSLLRRDGRSSWAPVINLREVIPGIKVEEVESLMRMAMWSSRVTERTQIAAGGSVLAPLQAEMILGEK